MSIIISFIKLSSMDKLIAIESLFWMMVLRGMVWIFPFPFVQKKVQKISSYFSNSKKTSSVTISKIRLWILVTSHYVPRATCLVQALAGFILLSKYGYTTQIKIGVLNEDGVFEAHAWLEHRGSVVLGESEKDYKTILDLMGDYDNFHH